MGEGGVALETTLAAREAVALFWVWVSSCELLRCAVGVGFESQGVPRSVSGLRCIYILRITPVAVSNSSRRSCSHWPIYGARAAQPTDNCSRSR